MRPNVFPFHLKKRFSVALFIRNEGGWNALVRDECVAYHRHGRGNNAGLASAAHPDTICLDPGTCAYFYAASSVYYTEVKQRGGHSIVLLYR